MVLHQWFTTELYLLKKESKFFFDHFKVKFDLWMCYKNMQVTFNFGSWQIIFGIYTSWTLKKKEKFSVSGMCMYKKSIYKADIEYVS